MHSTAHGTGHVAASGFLASLVGRWREFRMLRDAESLPFDVMKDIGFRATEHANAK